MRHVSETTVSDIPMPATTDTPPRPMPAGRLGKNLHAGFRTTGVWASVLLLVTVVPLISLVLGALVGELTGTRWPGLILATLLSALPLLGAFSLARSLLTKGYVLVMDDRGLSYDQQKKHAHPIAWDRIITVEQTAAVDEKYARFRVVYGTLKPDGSHREQLLLIDQSQLDASSQSVREVLESRIGPLDRVEQGQPDTWGDKLRRGVALATSAAVTEKLME